MYENFRNNFKQFVVITPQEISKVYPFFNAKNLVNWQKKGYLIKLRNNYYLLSETMIDEYKLYFIANKMYSPSYVSMESALNYHGIIPEGVYRIQSVSTRKTNLFDTKVGIFNYQTIKKELFFGYCLVDHETTTFKIASIEKAVLDFLYLRTDIRDYYSIKALRWNKDVLKGMDKILLQEYLNLFCSPVLNHRINLLKKYLDA
ncbi:MAG: hypothetical protein IPK35_07690 [Saprospiraceae bacterium]|nr:hypothetical protein [Saprospiraceae bacterium]